MPQGLSRRNLVRSSGIGLAGLMAGAGVVPGAPAVVPGPLDVRLWPARMPAPARTAHHMEQHLTTQDVP